MWSSPEPYFIPKGHTLSNFKYIEKISESEEDMSLFACTSQSLKRSLEKQFALYKDQGVTDFFELVSKVHVHLLFTPQTKEVLEEVIHSNGALRDFIYSSLTRLKFDIGTTYCHFDYDDLIENISQCGYDDEAVQSNVYDIYPEFSVGARQETFHEAYVTNYNQRKALLLTCEYNVIIFLADMFYVDLIGHYMNLVEHMKETK